MKKLFFVLICAAGFSLVSCGSTKDQVTGEIDSIDELVIDAPDIETEELETEESKTEAETEAEGPEIAQGEELAVTVTPESNLSYDNPDYPPLEEIEEPELIDISPEEIEEQAAVAAAKEEEQEKLAEPVAEEDATPPLPVAESASPEPVEGPQEEETSQDQENLEPTIEVQTEEEAEPEPEILPSRSVSLKKGETLVITYPGSGWIYMGSTSEYNNLASRGRKLGTTDTKYTLLAKEAGTQIHHFYKVDNLTGNYIDDYIEVTVLEKKGTSSTVVNAPDYKEVVPKKAETPAKSSATIKKEAEEKAAQQAQQEEAKTEKTETKAASTATTSSTAAKKDEDVIVIDDEETQVVEVLEEGVESIPDLEAYMTQAKSLIQSKDYVKAYNNLTTYLEYANDGRDEALYMLGQLLESDSPIKNIKEAINTYQSLCDSYPASKYWDSANKRIIYLKRFYIDIH